MGKYNPHQKPWKCTLRNYTCADYNWRKVIGHVTSTHPTRYDRDDICSTELPNAEKAHIIKQEDGDTNHELLDMELKYGRVKTVYRNDYGNNDKWVKIYHVLNAHIHRATCGTRNTSKLAQ